MDWNRTEPGADCTGTVSTARDRCNRGRRAHLQTAVDALNAKIVALKRQYRSSPMFDRIADVEVYLDAVRRPLKYDERLYAGRGSTPVSYAQQTLATGTERATQLATGSTPWMTQSGVRGFYSRIDGSAQPYLLTMPDEYDPAAKRTYRLDIFMHGRDDTVLEQQFMAKSLTGYASKPFAAGTDRFMLQPYGRYTNASRFAGETDGLEAIASVQKNYPIDANRIVMAGFSMGGASAWSYIVHFADRWAAGAPGAGFTETEVFLRGALARQPQNAVQRTLWHMYDSTDYAINTFNLPVVAYSGEIDAQKQAADAMAVAMLAEGLKLEHIIGPNTGHSYEPGARQRLQERLDQLVSAGRNPTPSEIRFTTWMLRYNKMFWVTVDAMGEEWQRARVNAKIDGSHHHRGNDERDRLEPGFPAWPRAVSGGNEAHAEDRFRHHSTTRRARRQIADRRTRAERHGLENRHAERSSQDTWPAGADRRCVHGRVCVRDADGAATVGGQSGSGRKSRQTMRCPSGFISFAASLGSRTTPTSRATTLRTTILRCSAIPRATLCIGASPSVFRSGGVPSV